MPRFVPKQEAAVAIISNPTARRLPFKDFYATVEEEYVYVNMEAIEQLTKGMTTLRDLFVDIDISGSMRPHYKSGAIRDLVSMIVDMLAQYDDDGIDLMFFSNGLVFHANVKSADDVEKAIQDAIEADGAFKKTLPAASFQKITDQLKAKGRDGTVFFLTDGQMDDGGAELVEFYKNVLHKDFRTRDKFYCYSIEFGRLAANALKVLDGLFPPEQGAEDLFDVEQADHLDRISSTLQQVAGMSVIGSDVTMESIVSDGLKIDMVNADIIPGGQTTVSGPINQVMSYRVVANGQPFELTIKMPGYEDTRLRVTPKGLDAEVEVL